MGVIIGFAGQKTSGKNTCANILHGIVLKKLNMINDYSIGSQGELIVKLVNGGDQWSILNITRKDDEFVDYAETHIWPYVKIYSFADSLKWIGEELFDIPYECLYGTDEDKNRPIKHLRWENMPGNVKPGVDWTESLNVQYSTIEIDKKGVMTAREFMQYFGTEIMRKIWEPVWCNHTTKRILREDSKLAVVADVRFPNEADVLKEIGGKVYWLNRKMFEDSHHSENALKDYNNFDGVIENQGDGHTITSLIEKIESLYKEVIC